LIHAMFRVCSGIFTEEEAAAILEGTDGQSDVDITSSLQEHMQEEAGYASDVGDEAPAEAKEHVTCSITQPAPSAEQESYQEAPHEERASQKLPVDLAGGAADVAGADGEGQKVTDEDENSTAGTITDLSGRVGDSQGKEASTESLQSTTAAVGGASAVRLEDSGRIRRAGQAFKTPAKRMVLPSDADVPKAAASHSAGRLLEPLAGSEKVAPGSPVPAIPDSSTPVFSWRSTRPEMPEPLQGSPDRIFSFGRSSAAPGHDKQPACRMGQEMGAAVPAGAEPKNETFALGSQARVRRASPYDSDPGVRDLFRGVLLGQPLAPMHKARCIAFGEEDDAEMVDVFGSPGSSPAAVTSQGMAGGPPSLQKSGQKLSTLPHHVGTGEPS
jgi:hypothetical protein